MGKVSSQETGDGGEIELVALGFVERMDSVFVARREATAFICGLEIKNVVPGAEAESESECAAPADSGLACEACCCSSHGVEPPAFFGLEAKPVANGDLALLDGDVFRLNRPNENE